MAGLRRARGGAVPLHMSLRSVRQLFNSMDPSPFYERDLDADAERFLTSWAQDLPPQEPLSMVLHLDETLPGGAEETRATVADSIHNYFAERARLSGAELRRLLAQGRTSLGIGLAFLVACFSLAELVALRLDGVGAELLRESVMIAGWVAMWRPLEIYLYDWWPILREQRLYRRISRMPIDVRLRDPSDGGA